ncbi:MAG TPA: phosphatidylglycerol lysyltransferase domain-containing protein [Aeromicrobium sp.]|nr:phosphatidylglycerol lysyltransferase domain-containing protein [Aeromicrobium sp.]
MQSALAPHSSIDRRIQLRRPIDAPPVGVGPRVPRIAGLFVAVVALINIGSALTPSLTGRLDALRSVAAIQDIEVAHAMALPAGLALLFAADRLARGSRTAANAAIVLLGVAALLNLLKGLDVEECVVSLAAAFTLWAYRDEFAFTNRAVRPRVVPQHDPEERAAAAALCRAHGTGTLGAFALRRDVGRIWSPDRRALMAFRIEAGVLVLAGDPVGDPASHGRVLDRALTLARTHGLAIAAIGASDAFAALAATRGLRHLYLGDEALIATGAVDLTGRARKGLRTTMNRVLRHGYTATVHRVGELDDPTLLELERISELWRDGAAERGFSMGHDRLRDELLPDAVLVIARDADDHVRGFLGFMPVSGKPQLSLAFMRRDRDTPNGLSEFMVLRAAETFAGLGIEEFSLNFAMFAGLRRSPRHAGERALVRVLLILDRFFNVGGLEGFNDKFNPVWVRRHLLFAHPTSLPRVIVAALACEGFVRSWRSGSAPRQLTAAISPAGPTPESPRRLRQPRRSRTAR